MRYVNCNLCGADNWTVRFPSTLKSANQPGVEAFRCTSPDYGEHAQIVECAVCGYVYANPTWEPSDLLGAYETVVDETYAAEREGRELTFQKHLETLEALIGPGDGRTLLDVGAYIGVFVDVAQRAGWTAEGVEPSAWAVAAAQQHGLPVTEGTLDAPHLAGRQFDVVTMWDVIEHVSDPLGELEKAYARTKPGGVVVVHTMDIGSPIAKLLRGRWPWLMAMHIHYFSRRTLTLMIEKAGFRPLRVQADGRYLRMGYLASRVAGLNPTLGRVVNRVVHRFKLAEKPVPINFGDLITVTAVRPYDT